MDSSSGLGEFFLASGIWNIGLGLLFRRRASSRMPVRPVGPGTGVGAGGAAWEITDTGAMVAGAEGGWATGT